MNVVYQVRYFDDDANCYVSVAGLPVYASELKANEVCAILKFHPHSDGLVIDVFSVEVV